MTETYNWHVMEDPMFSRLYKVYADAGSSLAEMLYLLKDNPTEEQWNALRPPNVSEADHMELYQMHKDGKFYFSNPKEGLESWKGRVMELIGKFLEDPNNARSWRRASET